MSRLTTIFTLQAFMLTMSISTAIAEIALQNVHPQWLFPSPPNSKVTANSVTTTLLPQLIGSDDQLRQRLGFSSIAQIKSLVLRDPPFAVFRLGLSRLKNFNPLTDSPLSLLLADENWFPVSPPPTGPPKVMPVRFLFPIRESSRPTPVCANPSLVDIPILGCVASSVQVKWLSGTWEFQQIGRPGLIKKLSQLGSGDTHFVIWIPALNLHYLARLSNTDLMITAITNDTHVKDPITGEPFAAGKELRGTVVFEQLNQKVQSIHPDDPAPG